MIRIFEKEETIFKKSLITDKLVKIKKNLIYKIN